MGGDSGFRKGQKEGEETYKEMPAHNMPCKTSWENLGGAKKREERIDPPNFPESFTLGSILAEAPTPLRWTLNQQIQVQAKCLGGDNPGAIALPWNMSRQSSSPGVPLSYVWRPFPWNSLALSACVSPQTVHFWVSVRQEPALWPWKGAPFLQLFGTSFLLDVKTLLQHTSQIPPAVLS